MKVVRNGQENSNYFYIFLLRNGKAKSEIGDVGNETFQVGTYIWIMVKNRYFKSGTSTYITTSNIYIHT